jgi:hypothetical protein
MAAGAWTLTNTTRTKLINGQFDLDSDTFRCALLQSSSNIGVSSTTYTGLTNEVANGNGYTTGGATVAFTIAGTTSVTVTPTASITWTASGGSIVARYAVIYEVGGDVLAYCLLDNTPADVTTTTGNTLTISNSNPVLTVA